MKYFDIDPDTYFKDWHYKPVTAHYPAFSITKREVIDREKTQLLRASAREKILNGKKRSLTKTEQQAVTKNKVMKLTWRSNTPQQYDFHVGDVFWDNHQNFIQVSDEDEEIELLSNQSGRYTAYKMAAAQLAEWLKTGDIPDQYEISPTQCSSEHNKYLILAQSK